MAESTLEDIEKTIAEAEMKAFDFMQSTQIKREEEQRQHEAEQKQLQADFLKVASTDEGKNVLNKIMQACGFFDSSINVKTDNETGLYSTACNEHQRLVWLRIREHFLPRHAQLLSQIEYLEYYRQLDPKPEGE